MPLPLTTPPPAGQTDLLGWANALRQGWIQDASLPLTHVEYSNVVNLQPPCDPGTTHRFTGRMLAFPLTLNGPPGSAPNGRSTWWSKYFNTRATGHARRAWVQGHLLNNLVHGPGKEENLVPITDELNRIMEKWAEKFVKEQVAQRKVLKYEVTVQWMAGMPAGSSSDWQGNAARHPQAMHAAFDNLQTGECLAPTSLSWKAWEVNWNGQAWAEGPPIKFGGYEGIENGVFPNSWNG